MADNLTTQQLISYYANLLIIQYLGKPKAYNTILSTVTPIVIPQQSVQTITFSVTPSSGTFVLSYDGNNTASINWNDNASAVQTKLQGVSGLSQVTVSGSIDSTTGLTVNFVGVTPVAQLLITESNNLSPISTIKITETDLTLPLALQAAFDVNTAVGVQLDILGKYAGVIRTITIPTQTIVLNDTDFRTLIKFAIVQNNSGSSLATIEQNLNIFFPNDFIVTDYKTMYISYIFGSSLGSINLFQALVEENLIPRPMGVGISVVVPPVIDQFFGYSTYESGGVPHQNKPYNRYEAFDSDWIYLQYQDFIY